MKNSKRNLANTAAKKAKRKDEAPVSKYAEKGGAYQYEFKKPDPRNWRNR